MIGFGAQVRRANTHRARASALVLLRAPLLQGALRGEYRDEDSATPRRREYLDYRRGQSVRTASTLTPAGQTSVEIRRR